MLALSIALGIYIIVIDEHIYEHAASHAYTLMGFVSLDAFLLGFLKFRPNRARKAIMVLAAVQFVVMNLDIFTTASIPIFQVEDSMPRSFSNIYTALGILTHYLRYKPGL